MTYRGRNSKSINYYRGVCAGCGRSLVAKRLESNATGERWVMCGRETGCGTVTLLTFEDAVAPESEMTRDEWVGVFDDA